MSKEKLEECFKGYLEQANNLGERGFCQDTDDYREFEKDAIDEMFGYMYECGFSANKKQAECYKQLQRKTAEYEELKKNNDFADVVLQRKLDKLMNKNNRLEEELNQIKLLLEGKNNQYNAKQQECEELKKALAIKTGKDYINEIQDIQMKYECHQKSLGMCWWGKYGKETECIGIRECHKKELEVIKNLEHKLQIATEALGLILNGYGNDELDLENDYNPIRIADEALEQIGSEE